MTQFVFPGKLFVFLGISLNIQISFSTIYVELFVISFVVLFQNALGLNLQRDV